MTYLILLWLGLLTAALVILWNRVSEKLKDTTQEWTVTPRTPVTKSVQMGDKQYQYVEFLGADRVSDILTEKKDPKIDDILI
jgi:trimethylamine:corrinoid methyltransferase-like protein